MGGRRRGRGAERKSAEGGGGSEEESECACFALVLQPLTPSPPPTLSECATLTSSVAPALTLFLDKGMGGEKGGQGGEIMFFYQKTNRVECTFSNRREAQRILWRIPALLIPPIFFFLFSSCFLYVLHTLLSALPARPPLTVVFRAITYLRVLFRELIKAKRRKRVLNERHPLSF